MISVWYCAYKAAERLNEAAPRSGVGLNELLCIRTLQLGEQVETRRDVSNDFSVELCVSYRHQFVQQFRSCVGIKPLDVREAFIEFPNLVGIQH